MADLISDTHLLKPITEKIRQVDHHGGYTAGADMRYTPRGLIHPLGGIMWLSCAVQRGT